MEWPERQGDIKAIILIQSRRGKHPEYDVYEQNETNGPWNEGSNFFPSTSRKYSPLRIRTIEGHSFVIKHYVDGNGISSEKIVAIAHNESELKDKTYQCSVNYCKKRARAIGGKFIDQTEKGLANLVQSKS